RARQQERPGCCRHCQGGRHQSARRNDHQGTRAYRYCREQRNENRSRKTGGASRSGVGHDDEYRPQGRVHGEPGRRKAHDRPEVRQHRQYRLYRRPFSLQLAGAYSVVKAGLIMLTKLQAMEWAPYGIRANAITPGYIRTPGTEAMYADPEIYEGRRKGVPMGRVGSGEDIAGPAIFLASDESRYTTGSVVGADGGQAVGYFLTVPGRRFSGGRID